MLKERKKSLFLLCKFHMQILFIQTFNILIQDCKFCNFEYIRTSIDGDEVLLFDIKNKICPSVKTYRKITCCISSKVPKEDRLTGLHLHVWWRRFFKYSAEWRWWIINISASLWIFCNLFLHHIRQCECFILKDA